MKPFLRCRPARAGHHHVGASSTRVAAWVALVALVGLAGCRADDDATRRNIAATAEEPHSVDPAGPVAALVGSLAGDARATGGVPLVAIIVDDWGQARTGPQAVILTLPQPLTLAVLPCLPHSREIAALATDLDLPGDAPGVSTVTGGVAAPLARPVPATARREILLHMPMLPVDFPESNPGEPVLEPGMDAAEVERRLARSLATVPGARGVNNHMGSAATADSALMAVFMGLLARRHLFFVDSLTSPASIAFGAAQRAGVPALRNRIFLDADRSSEDAIAANLATLVAWARLHGAAVGIAHPYVATADVLARELGRYEAEGVRFVTVSELMAYTAPGAPGGGGVADGR